MNVLLLVVGLVMATILVGIGVWIGRWRFQSVAILPPGLADEDRQRLVGLLQRLSRWTSEYSDNVSQYQSDIGRINEVAKQNLAVFQANQKQRPTSEQSPADVRLVTLIGQMMTVNQQLQDKLDAAEKQLGEQTQQIESYLTESRTDGLTGLFNRRAFDRKLDEMFALWRGGGSPFVLVLIDIDHFKSINDKHGHPVGDVVLQRTSQRLNDELSDAVIVARFGGEEFAVLIDAPIRIAAERMNQVRKRIADEPIPAGGLTVKVTISVGLSQPQDDLVIGPLVRRADEALYSAKNIGRNRVYFNAGSGPQLVGAPETVKN